MAKDLIHNAVREALEKEGWKVLRDPFTVKLPDDDTFFDIDLSAEQYPDAHKPLQIAAIEIKSFTGLSVLYAFHEALGQYLNYRAALDEKGLEMELYLAVSSAGWERLASLNFILRRVEQFSLQFLVVDVSTKTIKKWIK